MLTLESAIQRFLSHCQTKGLSSHTLRAYRQDLGDFGGWVCRQNSPWPPSRDDMAAWVDDMRKRGLAPASLKRRLACLKVLFRWLEDQEILADNPFHRLRLPIRLPRTLPRNLTRQELKGLLAEGAKTSLDEAPMTQATVTLALELLFATGVRVGELCAIRLPDLDLAAGIIIIHGKGNRERRVFLVGDEIRSLVRDYLARREQ